MRRFPGFNECLGIYILANIHVKVVVTRRLRRRVGSGYPLPMDEAVALALKDTNAVPHGRRPAWAVAWWREYLLSDGSQIEDMDRSHLATCLLVKRLCRPLHYCWRLPAVRTHAIGINGHASAHRAG